jgi:hypothetical protein
MSSQIATWRLWVVLAECSIMAQGNLSVAV